MHDAGVEHFEKTAGQRRRVINSLQLPATVVRNHIKHSQFHTICLSRIDLLSHVCSHERDGLGEEKEERF